MDPNNPQPQTNPDILNQPLNTAPVENIPASPMVDPNIPPVTPPVVNQMPISQTMPDTLNMQSTTPLSSVQSTPPVSMSPVQDSQPSGVFEQNSYNSVEPIGPLTDVPPAPQPESIPAPQVALPPLADQNKISPINIVLLILAVILILALAYIAYAKLTAKTPVTGDLIPQVQVQATEAPMPTVAPTPYVAITPSPMPASDSPDIIKTVLDATPSSTP